MFFKCALKDELIAIAKVMKHEIDLLYESNMHTFFDYKYYEFIISIPDNIIYPILCQKCLYVTIEKSLELLCLK